LGRSVDPPRHSRVELQPRQLEVAAQQAVAERAEGPVTGFGCRGGRFRLVSRTLFEGLSAGLVEGFEAVGEEGRLEGEKMFFESRDWKLGSLFHSCCDAFDDVCDAWSFRAGPSCDGDEIGRKCLEGRSWIGGRGSVVVGCSDLHLGYPLSVFADRVPAIGETDDRVKLAPFPAACEDLCDARPRGGQRDLIPPPLAEQLEILRRNDVGHSSKGREEILDGAVVLQFFFVFGRHAGSVPRHTENLESQWRNAVLSSPYRYNATDNMRLFARLIIGVCLVAAVPTAAAGPWGALPDAIARLQANPQERSALAVVSEAEASILREATNGHLAAVAVLMETYASLVVQLDSGESRLQGQEARTGAALVAWADERQGSDPTAAATAWTLAAKYVSTGPAIERLRRILLPPTDPEDGQTWRSAVDRAELIYQPPLRVRVGCSENDGRCRENEIYFRWVDVPGFWIEATEVTNQRYRLCVDAGHCSPPSDDSEFNDPGRGQHPVVGVSWNQARNYARWTGRRLPSEAGWERVARAKVVRSRFPWGRTRRTELANVWDEMMPEGRGPLPVATFPVTGWGVFDISGNVWEWCQDRYQTGFKELPADGSPTRNGVGRVVRGGSWRRDIDLARVSARSWFEESYRGDDLGFRCAMDRSSEISDSKVRSIADRVFALQTAPGSELAGVELSAEDRRYLERRALTWLMLERRANEAMVQAATILRRDPRDPVALDLLDWVEGEMVEQALGGNTDSLVQLRSRYLRAMARSPRFERRMRETDERLVDALGECGAAMARNGERERAEDCFAAGLAIDPSNPRLRRGRDSLEPAAGETRIWPSDGRVVVWVPSGSFRFGASLYDRQIAIDELPAGPRVVAGFWLDRNEVTNADYRRCVEAGQCTPPSKTEAYDDPNQTSHPVLWVSWYQASEFARWTGKRLPSEVEWERAVRAGSGTRFPWGDTWEPGRANIFDTGEGDRWGASAPVGTFPANAWGIHDLIGNAAEWVQDVYHTSYGGGPRDGTPWEQETGPSVERRRVVRGGSYFDPPSKQRVSRRASRKPTSDHRTTGFRCAAD